MAALDFPGSPSVNDTYSANGKTFKWDGTVWTALTVNQGWQAVYGVSSPTIIAGVLTLNYSLGGVYLVNLNAAITSIVLTNVPATGMAVVSVRFQGDGTLRAITWPGNWRFGTAGPPSAMTLTNGKHDWVQATTVDGSTTWDAYLNGQNF